MLDQVIAAAVAAPEPAARNSTITAAYAAMASALEPVLGRRDAAWPHFGAWASASAGSIIRGERRVPDTVREAVLAGNTAIIADVGPRFVRFLALVDGSRDYVDLAGRVKADPLLTVSEEVADAFDCYARIAHGGPGTSPRGRSQLMLRANVQIAHHEQHFADALIDHAIPGGNVLGLLASQAVSFQIPEGSLRVTRDVPRPSYLNGEQWPADLDRLDDDRLEQLAQRYRQDVDSVRASNATDWQDLDERMGFIFCFFRAFQQDPRIRENPLTH